MFAVTALLMLMGPAAPVPADPETTCGDVRIEVRAPKGSLPRREPREEPRREPRRELVRAPGQEPGQKQPQDLGREQHQELRREEAAFSARQIQDLEFLVTAKRPRGPELELWLYTPKGYVYQTLKLPAPAQDGPGVRRSADRVTLPVNGTLITVNGLYGRWRVEPHLDRAAKPCGVATEFRLRP